MYEQAVQEDIEFLLRYAKEHGFDLLTRAIKFAVSRHGDNTRNNGELQIAHPIRACARMRRVGFRDEGYLSVVVLHDVLEDTYTTEDELRKEMGEDIAGDVIAISKRVRISADDYFAGIRSRVRRIVAKIFDRNDNLGDIIKTYERERQKAYVQETRDRILPLYNVLIELGALKVAEKVEGCMYDMTRKLGEVEAHLELMKGNGCA